MNFLDQELLLDVIQSSVRASQLTFKVVDSDILNFSVQLPFYLNTPQDMSVNGIKSQINDLELLSKVSFE